MQYRAEIDGLRALAVVPVILFHAGFDGFAGGYVGVDVFFVISGYLITSIILADLENESFSLREFYERRARRILPALFVVCLLCMPFAWFLLLPADLNSFAKSLLAVATFTSNFYFWLGDGYFSPATDSLPLIHTWSLAVEEQFYILFPLLLMALWRTRAGIAVWVLAAVFVLSLILSQQSAAYAPAAAFYLLPTRVWELLLGSFAAFYLRGKAGQPSLPMSNGFSIAGVLLIVYAVLTFDEETRFPGFAALLPTVGTFLIIVFATKATLINTLLSLQPLVGVGLISYSAYLWHQVLFAFLRQPLAGTPNDLKFVLAIFASLGLAFLTWKFVELPMRNRSRVKSPFVVQALMPAWMLLVFCALLATTYADSIEERWLSRKGQSELLALLQQSPVDWQVDEQGQQDFSACRFNADRLSAELEQRLRDCHDRFGPGVAILGDSHARDLYGVVASRFPTEFLIGLTQGGCRPHTSSPQCDHERFLDFAAEHRGIFSHVIYEQAGFYLLQNSLGRRGRRDMFTDLGLFEPMTGFRVDAYRVSRTVEYLSSLAEVVPVTWFGPRVEPHITLAMLFEHGCDYPYSLREGQVELMAGLDAYLEDSVAATPNLRFQSQSEVMGFVFPRDLMSCDVVYWSDGDHLSADGELRFGARLPENFLHFSE